MGADISATANVDELIEEETTAAGGTIDVETDRRTERYPLHIAFCVDRSGSMGQEMEPDGLIGTVGEFVSGETTKMDVARAGLTDAIDQLSSRDAFGVTAFNGSSTTVVGATPGDDTERAKRAVDDLEAGGGTDIAAGLAESRDLLSNMSDEDAVAWIVLISDGQGSVPADRTLEREYSDAGIVIQAAGVGTDYNRAEMLNLAQRTQGELEDITAARALKRFFTGEVQRARDTVARGAEVTIEPADFVTVDEVYYRLGQQTSTIDPEWRQGNCVVDLGDVSAETPPQIAFEMEATPPEVGLNVALATVTLETDRDRASDEITVTVDRRLTSDLAAETSDEIAGVSRSDPDPTPERITMKAEQKAQQGDIDDARRYLEANAEHLSREEYETAERRIDDCDVAGLSRS